MGSTSQQPLVLAVDLGTSSLKVALVSIDGKIHGWESQPLDLLLTSDGGAMQRPEDWWQAFISCSLRVLNNAPGSNSRIAAVCCSTQGEGTIAVDRSGNPLADALLWMDMRGASCLKRQLRGWINVEGVSLRRLMQFVRMTGGAPSMSGKDPAGHILWLRDHRPDVYEHAYKFLNVLDYMNHRLSGRFVATHDSIVTNWVTDNRQPGAITYNNGLISMLGIDGDKLPEIVACAEVIGALKSEVADQLGLSRDVMVVAGAIDNTAAAVGSGAIDDYAVHLYIGTSSWFGAHVPFKKTDMRRRLASIPCAVPGRYLMTALQATAGGNLTFLKERVLHCRDELSSVKEPPEFFQAVENIVNRVPPGSNGLIYTPWIWGERAPVEDPLVRAGFFNLSLNHSRAEMIRAVLEGVAMNCRWCLPSIEKFLRRSVSSIHLVGGGAQSNAWCQIFADVMNVEVKQVVDPIAANARGAAWIAAVGLGELSFNDLASLVQFSQSYTPEPESKKLIDQRFSTFKQIYRRMKPIHRRLNGPRQMD